MGDKFRYNHDWNCVNGSHLLLNLFPSNTGCNEKSITENY